MKCLFKYKWVKLPRDSIPNGKGLMGRWMNLASSAAFRKGYTRYCGYANTVITGMWSGGVVGLKSILGVKRRPHAMFVLSQLQELGYLSYTVDPKTKKLTYVLTDWVMNCTGEACADSAACATDGYGFLCVPRDITERLAEKGYVFEETDAWLDLWCHTVFRDYGNAFSFLAPAIQYRKYGAVLTLDTLGKRWGWEKTKVWRFFRKFGDYFALYRLPGSFGCVIYNLGYPSHTEITRPSEECVMRILKRIRICARNTHTVGTDNERINRFVAWKSNRVAQKLAEEYEQSQYRETAPIPNGSDSRVADLDTITRAYFSHSRNCKNSKNCIYDCQGKFIGKPVDLPHFDIGILYPFRGFALNTS